MSLVIQIASAAFSGSTMLDLMLSNSQRGFSCGEVYALFRPWRPHHFEPTCACGVPNCDLWQRIKPNGEARLYETILSFLPDVSYVVDSSKDLVWYTDQSRYFVNSELEPVYVLLWKDPLEYAYSCWKRGGTRGRLHGWATYYEWCFSISRRWHSVRYRDLAQAPAETLSGLCSRIGIEYRDEMEYFWNQHPHTLFGSDSVKAHLLVRSSPEFSHLHQRRAAAKPNLTPEELLEFAKHRTIYYDRPFVEKLPRRVKAELDADSRIGPLLALLESTDFRQVSEPGRIDRLVKALGPRPARYWYWKFKLFGALLGAAARLGIRLA